MSDYEALTTRLAELTAAASPGPIGRDISVSCCHNEYGLLLDDEEAALAAPAHEYAAVALAAVSALALDEDELGELADCPSCGHELWRGAHDDGCWYVALKDALDALQARVLP